MSDQSDLSDLSEKTIDMEFRTIVDIQEPCFRIEPRERMLFVGSCFADHIGRRFRDEQFRADVNPYGVMYNPASILHSVSRYIADGHAHDLRTAVFTLGTNHIYILRETGEIVDNCQKRPQRLFTEQELTVSQCADYLTQAISALRKVAPGVRVLITVSPIRYRKYGYHGSQLSKATLLLAANQVVREADENVAYFPAYEIINDELRDYRFYAPDMLHPSEQAVEYIWQRLTESCLSSRARTFIIDYQPIKDALAHKPFHPESEEYKAFMEKTREKIKSFEQKYGALPYSTPLI